MKELAILAGIIGAAGVVFLVTRKDVQADEQATEPDNSNPDLSKLLGVFTLGV